MTDEDLLIQCDSVLSLVLHRESVGMLRQTKSDIQELLRYLRPRTEAIVEARRAKAAKDTICRAQGEGNHGQTWECTWPKGHTERIHSWQVCGHTVEEGCTGHGDF